MTWEELSTANFDELIQEHGDCFIPGDLAELDDESEDTDENIQEQFQDIVDMKKTDDLSHDFEDAITILANDFKDADQETIDESQDVAEQDSDKQTVVEVTQDIEVENEFQESKNENPDSVGNENEASADEQESMKVKNDVGDDLKEKLEELVLDTKDPSLRDEL